MSHNTKNPFDDEFEDDSSGEGLLSTRDLAHGFSSELAEEDFDGTFSVPKVGTKSKKYDKKFVESEDLEDSEQYIEINNDNATKNKAEVYINRLKNGELESIEVVASNGERILIKFEIDENIEGDENNSEDEKLE